MSRVIAVVEGQTERSFVEESLAPWLAARKVFLSARLVGAPGHKGGGRSFDRPKVDILKLLKQESATVVTTMFDFYGMIPKRWPGREKATNAPHDEKSRMVEEAIAKEIAATLKRGFDRCRFVPYVQMHEFEALLFAQPELIAEVVQDESITKKLKRIREEFGNPEEINDDPRTHPAARITKLSSVYKKTLHGIIAAKRIGIETIREECPHFNEWLTALEKLGGTQ